MKKLFLLLPALLAISLSSFSQVHEFRVGLNTGYSFFRGESSESTTIVNAHGTSEAYPNSPLGKKFTFSFGVGANYKYVTSKRFILGAEVAYEDLRTKVNLMSYNDKEWHSTSGRTILNNHFLNLNPFVGYRIPIGESSVDIIAGIDVAYALSAKEYGKYKDANGETIKFTHSRNSYLDFDFRPRFQLNLNCGKYTIFSAVSIGLVNYYKDMDGGKAEAYANTIRLGVQYKIF